MITSLFQKLSKHKLSSLSRSRDFALCPSSRTVALVIPTMGWNATQLKNACSSVGVFFVVNIELVNEFNPFLFGDEAIIIGVGGL